MSEITKTYLLTTQPGIQRDGTLLDAARYSDGQWVRFYRNRPRKMHGYQAFAQTPNGPVRALYTWSRQGLTNVSIYSSAGIGQLQLDKNGNVSSLANRNATDYTPADYVWTVDAMYDAAVGSNKTLLIAHGGDSLTEMDDETGQNIYTGDITTTDIMTSIPGMSVSGGIVVAAPYLFAYGSDGYLAWSNANEPRNFTTGDADHARITGSKIVKALPIRGSVNSPSIMAWSLDSVLRINWVGGSTIFKSDPITAQSSILAQNSVIEYDGAYFWIGLDRFLCYTGSMQELPNDYNLQWFFDNLNFSQRQKIWATKMPKWGEIWWFFPSGDSVECDRAIIFNVRMKCWYDAALTRSAGYYSQTYRYPIMADSVPDPDTDAYDLWLHDIGTDRVKNGQATAIHSWFETSDFGLPTGGSAQEAAVGVNRWTRLARVEPDFVQTGDMYMQVRGREFAKSEQQEDEVLYFNPETERIDVRTQYRQITLKFGSNTTGGNYEAGKVIMQLEEDGVRS